ncbi:MAG: hypothetical protein OHK0044_21920 [Burkholderiaceae bacterium]
MARPWYREPWPWLLIALPAAVVVGGIVTAVIAFRGADGVVAADYYKRGLAINEELSRSRLAAALGIEAELRIGGVEPGDAVDVRLTAERALPPEAALRVHLVHPGRGGADRSAVLARVGIGIDGRSAEYMGSWGEAAAVTRQPAWRVVIETAQWRLDGDAVMEDGRPAKVFRVGAQRRGPGAADAKEEPR